MENDEKTIVVYGTTWCYDCRLTRAFFDQYHIPYRWVDINRDADGRAFVEKVNHGNRSVPTIVFPDGSLLVEPGEQDLYNRFGISPAQAGA